MYLAQGVSYIQCKRCYFVDNHGNNTDDEYGGAIAIYRVNQFESRDSVPRYDFIDWYRNHDGHLSGHEMSGRMPKCFINFSAVPLRTTVAIMASLQLLTFQLLSVEIPDL